jgi:hypothetical protein
MKKEILKVLFKIKENLKSIEDDGVSHSLLDDIFEDVEQIEDIIYNDDVNSAYGIDYDNGFE